MLNLTSEYPYSEDHFEIKSQDKISPSEKILDKPEEELIELKEENHDDLRKLSSVLIQSEVLNLAYQHPSYEDHFEKKSQDNISP